jgi:uncharacterized membrane protein
MADTETTRRHPLVEDYLQRLEVAAAGLPRGRRKELIADTKIYLDQAIKPDASAIEVRGLLGSLGTPEQLAAQDRPRAKGAADGQEKPAITLLAIGGLFIGIGWFVGLYFLWRSRVFTLTDKLIGTFLWPGGFATALLVALVYLVSSNPLRVPVATVVLAVPMLTAWYLARRVR